MDLFVAGRDQSAADQPNNLAEGHCNHYIEAPERLCAVSAQRSAVFAV